jgi:hypothetical protein
MDAERLPTTLLEDRFPQWWRPHSLELEGERLTRRRHGVEALRHALSHANAVAAVAYAHGDEAAGARIIDTVRVAVATEDPTFTATVGDAEPPALVAAALADKLASDPDSELSTLVALLTLGASYGGHTPVIARMPLSEYATRQLEHRAATMRRASEPLPAPAAGELVADALRALEPTPDEPWPDRTPERVRGVQAEIFRALAARIDQLAAFAKDESAVLREQLCQNTWVMESWCETADAPWEDVAPEARPMIAAVELAERTRGCTPAVDAAALLGSVLTAARPSLGVDPTAAIAAAGPYLERSLLAAPHPMLFPIATGLERWRRHGEVTAAGAPSPLGSGWQEELAISMQTYREALALRALANE